MKNRLLIALLLAGAKLLPVSADEVKFNSIQQIKKPAPIKKWVSRDEMAPDRIANVTNPSFVLMVRFSRDVSGEVRLWRRTKGVLTNVFELTGVPTLVFKPSIEAKMPDARQPMLSGAHYWKEGFYRAPSPNVTTILYQTGLVRASTFEAAVNAAFAKPE